MHASYTTCLVSGLYPAARWPVDRYMASVLSSYIFLILRMIYQMVFLLC